uniref:Hemolymph juvenile hormone binding protein n=1 Tax=Photinus pyralis TaxID=7054 RepID=A0A1Y1KR62_PHOPY
MCSFYFVKFVTFFIVFGVVLGKISRRLPADGPLYTEKPPWLKACKRTDPNLSKCLNEMFVQMFPQLAKGIPQANISPFEPLYLDSVSVSKGSGPITLAGSFINLTVVGPSNATPTFTSMDIPNRKMHSGIFFPLLDIKARYNLKGNILVLPLVGHGTSDLKLIKVDTNVLSDLSFPKVEGREILQIDHMNVNFKVGGMRVNLRNLFNGNEVLGQTLNSFLNQNSNEIITDLSESIGQSLGDILKELMNEVFSKIPTDLWLLEDDEEPSSQIQEI